MTWTPLKEIYRSYELQRHLQVTALVISFYLSLDQWLSSIWSLTHNKKCMLHINLVYTSTHLKFKFHEIIGYLLTYYTHCSNLILFCKICWSRPTKEILQSRNMPQSLKDYALDNVLSCFMQGQQFIYGNDTDVNWTKGKSSFKETYYIPQKNCRAFEVTI